METTTGILASSGSHDAVSIMLAVAIVLITALWVLSGVKEDDKPKRKRGKHGKDR